MIRLDRVTLVRDGARLLEDVSFTVPTGHALALMGAGGAGKSLILKLIPTKLMFLWPLDLGSLPYSP